MQVARSRLTITKNSINVIGPNVWNSIPVDIQNSITRESFKFKYKLLLLSFYETNTEVEDVRSLVGSADVSIALQ